MISSVSRAPPLVTMPTAPRVFQSMMLFEPIVPVSPSSCPSITSDRAGPEQVDEGLGRELPVPAPSNEWNVSGVRPGARLFVGT